MALKFKVKDIQKLEATLKSGLLGFSKEIANEVRKDMKKMGEQIVDKVESSPQYIQLKTDEALRGKLGLAKPTLRVGGDTDAEDLIRLLSGFEVKSSFGKFFKKITLAFPTLLELERKLTHSFTKVDGGRVIRGPQHSWFRWWEFGDRGEITTFTLLKSGVMAQARRSKRSKDKILDIIATKTRTGFAIQLPSLPPGPNSSIDGANLIQTIYQNYARIFPARIGKVVKRVARKNGGRLSRFFRGGGLTARART